MPTLPAHSVPQKTKIIDLHQDMLSGVSQARRRLPGLRFELPRRAGSHAHAIWSSLYPHDPDSSLLGQLEAHDELLGAHSSSLRLVTTVEDLDAEDPRTGVLPHSEGFHLPGIEPDTLDCALGRAFPAQLWR